MEGDFAVDPLYIEKDFTRVLLQQGRVLLPADWNALVAVFTGQMRSLARDLIGRHGGPAGNVGFRINNALEISAGVYWVGGIRVVCAVVTDPAKPPTSYLNQPYYRPRTTKPTSRGIFYLDVWEQHVSAAEDETLREVALGGPDTTSRARVVWQVRFEPIQTLIDPPPLDQAWRILLDAFEHAPRLRAEAKNDEQDEACIIAPDASYRGFENQLYRVEIHASEEDGQKASFKWSRDNGSIVFPVESISGDTATLQFLGRDQRNSVAAGDWVEVVDDLSLADDQPRALVQVKSVDRSRMTVTFTSAPTLPSGATRRILRRWERNAAPVNADNVEFELENGVMIAFSGSGFRRGDYWLIPARTALRDVIWNYTPRARPPHGPNHVYAPLAYWNGTTASDLRFQFSLTKTAVPTGGGAGGGGIDIDNNLLNASPASEAFAPPATSAARARKPPQTRGSKRGRS